MFLRLFSILRSDDQFEFLLGSIEKGLRTRFSPRLSSTSSMYARLIDYVPTPCYTHDVSRVYIYIFRYPWDITRSHDCTDRRRKNFTCRSRHVILTLSLNHPIWSSIRNSFLPFFPSILPLCRHPPSGWIPEMRANERVMDSARGACDRR